MSQLKPVTATRGWPGSARECQPGDNTRRRCPAEAVLAAGWEEQALHDAVAVCGLFNLMNRLVEGLGIAAGTGYFQVAGPRLADIGYTGLRELL